MWLNGHEYAKRQATHAGIGFTELPRTRIVTRGTEVTVNAFYKSSRIKQYLNCDARSHAVSGYADWRFS